MKPKVTGYNFEEQAISLLTQEAFYVQAGLIGASLAVAILISGIIRRIFDGKIPVDETRHRLVHTYYPRIARLITPFLFTILLGFAYIIASEVPVTTKLIKAISKLAFIWLLTNVLLVVVSNRAVAIFIGFSIAILTVLEMTGMLAATNKFLSGISFELGSIKLSMLGMTKGIFYCVLLFWLAGLISSSAERYLRRVSSLKYSSRELIIKFMNIFFYCIAGVITLNAIGVDMTALTVVGGALAVGLGFGLQKITSNFVSGIILLFENSIKAGDLIEVGGEKGWLRNSGIRYTLIETFDGREMLIPNEELVTSKVTNWTYSNTRARIEIKVGVSYESDLKLAARLILEAATSHPRCISDPAPGAFMSEFADNAAIFQLIFWVDDLTEGLLKPKNDVMFAILEKFAANNVRIPYPHHEVHVKMLPPEITEAIS